jgi:hypothetical protein
MPTFGNNDDVNKCPFVVINSDTQFFNDLNKILNLDITDKTTFIWYPDRPKTLSAHNGEIFISPKIIPKYPIYIISKGRWEKRYTSRYLEWCGIDYKIVVEPQEYDEYGKVINKNKILILPNKYLNKNQGGIPARNFVLEHARQSKSGRHWILDDNIKSYKRLYMNERLVVRSGVVFRVVEDYVDRYTNIKMAGHNYAMFAISTNLKPVIFNTRIYSSILLSNDIPFEWRGRYNEDTDLSLRLLKEGYPTVLFNCILAEKLTTLTQPGGNTDTIYAVKDAMYLKAKSLKDQHPDVVDVGERFGRIHHLVDYSKFKNLELIQKNNIIIPHKSNNYGMKIVNGEKYIKELNN